MNIFLLVTKGSTRKQTKKQMKGSVYLYQTAGQPTHPRRHYCIFTE